MLAGMRMESSANSTFVSFLIQFSSCCVDQTFLFFPELVLTLCFCFFLLAGDGISTLYLALEQMTAVSKTPTEEAKRSSNGGWMASSRRWTIHINS